jgi:hypothetical protein
MTSKPRSKRQSITEWAAQQRDLAALKAWNEGKPL